MKIASEPLLYPFFSGSPFFRRERMDGECARRREREIVVYSGCNSGSAALASSLSLLLFIDSKKYYNLCSAGKEKYNSLFRRVYKENDNGVPRMGESRPPPREEKGLKTTKGGRESLARQEPPASLGRRSYISSYPVFLTTASSKNWRFVKYRVV